jgi:hypothetical protein
MTNKINLITVCVDTFPTVYVRKLVTRFKQVTAFEVNAYCILYLDLDIVICNSFDKELEWIIKQNKPLSCVSDAINWLNNKYSSSMVIMQSNKNAWIYDDWVNNYESAMKECQLGGDQVWTGKLLDKAGKEVLYIDEKFPHMKANLKFHLAQSVSNGRMELPQSIPSNIKMVDCSGRPKPHEIKNVPYILENWHHIK